MCTGDSHGGLIIRPTYTLTNFIKLMLFLTTLQQEAYKDDTEENNFNHIDQLLKQVSFQIIKTQLPLKQSVLHYALYQQDYNLLNTIIEFSIKYKLFIQPNLDTFGKSPLHLALGNRTSLELIIKYYSNPEVLKDATLSQQGSKIFVDFLPNLIKVGVAYLGKNSWDD